MSNEERPSGTGTGKVRSPIDEKAVETYLVKHVEGFKAPCTVSQFTFGQSNPTYLVTSSTGKRYVLRKKPAGKLVSQTAHAIDREYKIIDAVGQTGRIPVPKMYCLCMDDTVLGTPFYVMEFLEGRIFTDLRMPEVETKEEREACWRSIIRVLAEMHKIRPEEIGLADFGSTKPFYPRQIKSLSKISAAQAAVTDIKTGVPVGPINKVDFLNDWYSKHCPQGDKWEGGIVHGDFKCDNMIFHPTKPEVIGVLDWELSTRGHPLSDLSNLLQPFYIPKANDAASLSGSHLVELKGISDQDLPIPSAETLIKLYCKEVGREYPIKGWNACVSFAFFRLAVIMQGIAARAARGQASSANASRYGGMYQLLGQLALDSAVADAPNAKL